MGLDITAYRKLTKLDAVFDASGEPIDPATREDLTYDMRCCVNPDFPRQAAGLEDRGIYRAEDSFGFRAGSYGGYNSWREMLAKLAGYPAAPTDRHGTGNVQHRHDQGAWNADGGPFHELIHFSDCEGDMGPVVSKKLAADFAEWDARAQALDDDWFYARYQDWRTAFEMAANDGAVSFH